MAEKEKDTKDVLIEKLKRKHKTPVIYELSVPLNDEGTEHAVAYLRKPTRFELSPLIKQIESDPMGALTILLNTIWLEGDERIKEDDDVFFGAIGSLQEIITFRVGNLKKN